MELTKEQIMDYAIILAQEKVQIWCDTIATGNWEEIVIADDDESKNSSYIDDKFRIFFYFRPGHILEPIGLVSAKYRHNGTIRMVSLMEYNPRCYTYNDVCLEGGTLGNLEKRIRDGYYKEKNNQR